MAANPHRRYHLVIADSWWPKQHESWHRYSKEAKQDIMLNFSRRVQDFLSTTEQPPEGKVAILQTNEEVQLVPLFPDAEVTVQPL